MVDVQDRIPLNVVKYATKDFQSFFDALLRRLKTQYSDIYNDYVTTDEGIMLIDLMAYSCSQLAWYMDRRASDVYLATARTSEAVERIVKQIGYKMSPPSASTGSLKLTFEDGIPANGVLPVGFKFQGPSNLIFESIADLVLTQSFTSVVYNLSIKQGVTKLLTYTSDGSSNQSYRFSSVPTDKYLAEDSVKCYVDGQEWTEVDFLEFEKTNQFEVSYNDVPPLIRFGNGVAGNIPEDGAEIRLQFVVIEGKDGNVKSNTITSAIDTLKIIGEKVSFTVNNEDGTSGGTDPETADKARTFAPYSFAARGAAITSSDYKALTASYVSPQYGSVAQAFAHVIRSSDTDEYLNSLVDVIAQIVDSYVSSVSSSETAIDSASTSLPAEVVSAQSYSDAIESIRTDTLVPQIGSILSATETARAEASAIVGDMSSAGGPVSSVLVSMDAEIDTITAPEGVKESLETLSNQMSSLISSASTHASTVTTTINTIVGSVKILEDAITGSADTIQQNITDLNTVLSNMGTYTSTIITNVDSIVAASVTLDSDVDNGLSDLNLYLDGLFDQDCKSNVVQVPILVQTADGTYIAPSAGLIQSVQTYLESVQEVTHLVKVIDGSLNLVPVDMTINVKVLDTYVSSEVLSQVDTVATGILTGRSFNQGLYLSDSYATIDENVLGIDYMNISITNTGISYIDGEGNCVPPTNKIIQKNSVTVTEIE